MRFLFNLLIIIKLKWLWKLAFQIFIKAYNNMIQYFTGQRPIDVRASLTKMYTTQFKWPHTRILSPCVVYMWLLSHIKKNTSHWVRNIFIQGGSRANNKLSDEFYDKVCDLRVHYYYICDTIMFISDRCCE